MFKRRTLGFLLSFLLIFTAVFGSMPVQFAKAETDIAPATAVVAGNFQSKLGDTDWKGDSSITVMTYKGNGFYEYTTQTALPAGDYEYKIVLNGIQWIPDGFGNNLKFHLDTDSVVTFYYNYYTSSVTDSTKYTPIPEEKLPRIVGTIQSAIGAGDDWKPETSTAIMRDYKFNNVYEYTANVPKGYYEFKVTLGPSWAINYGLNGEQNGPNIPLNVAYDTKITFFYDSISHKIWTDYNPPLTGSDNNIYYDDLKHDTHDPFFRSPFGAIKTGETVTLRLQARNHDLESAQISYWDDIKKTRTQVSMYKIGQSPDGKYEYWEIKLSFDYPTRIWYYFILKDGRKTAYYGDDDEQLGGVGKATDVVNKDFVITVYDKNLDTPDWMKGAVMYQIFPDRFYNGDPSNDRLKEYSRGFDPVEYHDDWYVLPDNPRDKDKPGYTGDGIWNNDFFGGDLQGIIDKLDYLKELGISVIYLNPIFQSPSNHRYDTTDYTKIDELLGDLDTFKTLMREAHAREIRVILDGVFNHTSDDSIYFDRYGKYLDKGLGAYQAWLQGDQSKSPYGDWYEIRPDGTYEGWWGFDSLPVIRQINGSEYNVKSWADFIINNPDAISKYWLNPDGDPNAGADGWRLDVANEVAHDFWVHFRDAINTVKPNAPMIAELWGDASLDLLGDSFNSVMNYLFRNVVIDFILDKPFDDGNSVHNPIDAAKLDQRLMSIYERYPLPVFYSTMNLLGSHDTMRILTVFGYNSADNSQNSQEAYDLAVKRLKLAAILQMGYPGMPSIYYGDEAGLSGGNDPDNRRTSPWGREDTDLQEFFKKVVNIRNENQVLKTGDLVTLYAKGDVYAFGRRVINGKDIFGKSYPDSVAIVVINKGDAKQVSIDATKFIRDGVTFTDALSGKKYTVHDGQIVVEVGSMDGAILISDPGQNLTAPQSIQDLKAVSGNGKVDLSWSAVDKAVSYNIYRSTVKGGLYEKIASNVTQSTYTDTQVTNGLKYVYAVTAVDGDGNESTLSNEVEAYPAFPIGWAGNMNQVDTHVIGVNNPVEVYAEVWAEGLTDKPGQGENMIAQLGYRYIGDGGQDATRNKVEGVEIIQDWTWVDARYVGDSYSFGQPNNDQYKAGFVPDMVGTWEYTMRFSSNQGQDWTQTDVKQFTVIPSNDSGPPTAPVLQQPGIESSRVTLNWSPSADDVAIFGYEIYKSSSETGPFIKIATVSDSVYNYVDTDVVNGNTYYYKVVAVDTSYNRTASNTVRVTPDIIPIKVTFNVTVPDYTPDDGVYIAGNFPDAFWNPSARPMTKTGLNSYSITLTLNEGTQLEYKYARGSWDKVEKGEYGEEIANRKITVVNQGSNTMVVNDVVQRWRDIPIYIYFPKDNTTVDANTNEIGIKGNTYKGAIVTINDESFVQQENGVFTKIVPLEYGVNIIKIHVEPSGEKNNELTKDITITVTKEKLAQGKEPTPTPRLESTPTESTKPAQEVSQGKVVVENDTTILTVDEAKVSKDIKDTSKKEIQFDLTDIGQTSAKALEIPVSVLNLIAENNKNITVKSHEIALQFDAKTLAIPKETIDLIKKAGVVRLTIEDRGKQTANSLVPVSKAYDITIKAGDNKIKIDSPVKLTFEVKDAKDIRKVGVYYLNEVTGKWEYVGGKVDRKANTVTIEAKHFSTYGAFEYNKEFKDVPKDFWAYDVINVLASRHIIKGMDDDNFAPNAKITRAQFAALMIRALGIEEKPYKGEFEDVKEGAWYANAIEAAYQEGIMLGDGKKMRPDDPITREEMAAVIMRVYSKLTGYKEENIGNTTFGDNNKISQWARNVVANAVKLGIVKGYEDNTFKPKGNATKAEAAAMLYRILEKAGNI
ncbi:alpha amylase N-terminal ig-like domain-containing protein [Caldanaerobacter subterraneus]|uniref:Glycosidase n=1 Tax=Caldanaerobacter subterraneus TaxID=911092 RepID=A0A4R2JA81_9THEO|nr:alpha amylase N-terminal ig-like domain-containing protein [Caldanaerobacter subterraneus]TCO56313.1 glycosidase [Caldanaerobacter subterraneus]